MSAMKEELKAICLSWEKLRLVYNGVLVLESVCLYFLLGMHDWVTPYFYLVVLPVLVVIANVCFTLGPAVECYLFFLGFYRSYLRWVLFVPGMLFAIFLALMTLGGMAFGQGMGDF